jgi:hypothetical protein
MQHSTVQQRMRHMQGKKGDVYVCLPGLLRIAVTPAQQQLAAVLHACGNHCPTP